MDFYTCSKCPRLRNPIYPDGPTPCPILFLGEAPDRDADRNASPLSGRPGVEFDYTYMTLAGLTRSDIYMASVVLCSQPDYTMPEQELVECCAGTNLGRILATVKPQVVVAMGDIALSLWPHLNINLEHGMPRWEKWGGWEGVLFPVYHPSVGMRQTGYMISLTYDFVKLGRFLRKAGL